MYIEYVSGFHTGFYVGVEGGGGGGGGGGGDSELCMLRSMNY